MRQQLHVANPPCLPYLGIHLTDITFIENGSADNISGLINLKKMRLYELILAEVQMYQQTPYLFEPVPFIQDYLIKVAQDFKFEDAYGLEPPESDHKFNNNG